MDKRERPLDTSVGAVEKGQFPQITPYFSTKLLALSLMYVSPGSLNHGEMIMKTLFGAVAGALAVGAVLVSYELGARQTFSPGVTPMTQMAIGPDGIARPYLVQASQTGYGQAPFMGQQPYGW